MSLPGDLITKLKEDVKMLWDLLKYLEQEKLSPAARRKITAALNKTA